MSRLTGRDIAVGATFMVGGVITAALAIAGLTGWSIAILGLLVGLIGVLARVQFASRRARSRQVAAIVRASRTAAERATVSSKTVETEMAMMRQEVTDLQGGMLLLNGEVTRLHDAFVRVAETLPVAVSEEGSLPVAVSEEGSLPVAVSEEGSLPVAVSREGESTSAISGIDAESVEKRPIGVVGFFGHGNYGDELFIDVFQQFLGDRFDLQIIPDLERSPYFSRPVAEKVADVDAIVMGGGDLVQQWNTDPRYFDRTYLRKPFYLAGVGVPIYQGSEKHKEKAHIINRLRRFFGDPNVKLIGMRDDFSANWIREKLEPTAPVASEPDIVCSLDLPAVTKPAGQPVLGIVTRQRRVDTPDDYTRLEELAEHAKQRGFRIRHIVLGIGSVGERDLENAPALDVPDKEVVYSEDLAALTRAIGECTVLASMKFHGTVVATMYGVPSIVLVPTNKNRNFMARIGRSELVAAHNSDKLIEIFGDRGPAPIDPRQVAMLRARATTFMNHLRNSLIQEVENA